MINGDRNPHIQFDGWDRRYAYLLVKVGRVLPAGNAPRNDDLGFSDGVIAIDGRTREHGLRAAKKVRCRRQQCQCDQEQFHRGYILLPFAGGCGASAGRLYVLAA